MATAPVNTSPEVTYFHPLRPEVVELHLGSKDVRHSTQVDIYKAFQAALTHLDSSQMRSALEPHRLELLKAVPSLRSLLTVGNYARIPRLVEGAGIFVLNKAIAERLDDFLSGPVVKAAVVLSLLLRVLDFVELYDKEKDNIQLESLSLGQQIQTQLFGGPVILLRADGDQFLGVDRGEIYHIFNGDALIKILTGDDIFSICDQNFTHLPKQIRPDYYMERVCEVYCSVRGKDSEVQEPWRHFVDSYK
ncbi:hypothetical protein F5B20DRAFT_581754 [Whalleya microplaca]|nr:hypothetical protein F5B20DRAFT_581754 [Whalleya microplaca]